MHPMLFCIYSFPAETWAETWEICITGDDSQEGRAPGWGGLEWVMGGDSQQSIIFFLSFGHGIGCIVWMYTVLLLNYQDGTESRIGQNHHRLTCRGRDADVRRR